MADDARQVRLRDIGADEEQAGSHRGKSFGRAWRTGPGYGFNVREPRWGAAAGRRGGRPRRGQHGRRRP
jgi:hypothetical protein